MGARLRSGYCIIYPVLFEELQINIFIHRVSILIESIQLFTAGFSNVRLIGIEGVLWASRDLKSLKGDSAAWHASLDFMRSIENDNSIIGLSPHIMGIGQRPL